MISIVLSNNPLLVQCLSISSVEYINHPLRWRVAIGPLFSPTSYMRLHSTAPLALLGLAGYALAHDASISRRKTMGFGPVHPHAKFHTSPASFARASLYTSDPYEIATSFVTELLQDQLSADNDFILRKDSYTDRATGITHVHFRQRINGLEVADGDINVNVKGATVISYGDSVSFVVTRDASTSNATALNYHPSFTVAMRLASPSWGSQHLDLMPNFAVFYKNSLSSACPYSNLPSPIR